MISSGGSRIFSQEGALTPKTYYFVNFLVKTAWKSKEFGLPGGGGGASLAPPLDPPMIRIVEIEANYCCESFLQT